MPYAIIMPHLNTVATTATECGANGTDEYVEGDEAENNLPDVLLLLVQAACETASGIGESRRLLLGRLRGIGGCVKGTTDQSACGEPWC